MADIWRFLTRRRGGRQFDWTDRLTYAYLVLGVVLMFGPVLWLVLSSFKTQAQLDVFPPNLLPYGPEQVAVPGHDEPLPLFKVTAGPHAGETLAQVRRLGIQSQLVDPKHPDTLIKVNVADRVPVQSMSFAWSNYTDLFQRFNFLRFLWNSVFITVTATLIMLLINSMAAFALAKYRFPGRMTVLGLVIGTLMVPQTVVLVPLFIITLNLGMVDSLWGVIIPGAATPTGVFLLRQYMLTIPDEILDAARMDKASEWKIYWRIVLPLSAPALAVLAILCVMWRWNDFLWPLIVLTSSEKFTLQIALNSFQGEFATHWNNLLAMTVLVLAPVVVAFGFLQKYIATGVASTGVK